jgi:hypothetical protein
VSTTSLFQEALWPLTSDLRILSESGFVFKVLSWLSTSISFTAHYDSRPPTGVMRTDTEIKNAITLTR